MALPLWILLLAATIGQGAVVQVRADGICIGDCSSALTMCVQEARDERRECRAACLDGTAPRGPCLRECRAAVFGARAECRGGAAECTTACAVAQLEEAPPDHGTPSCPGACGRALGQCLRDAADLQDQCLQTCPNGNGRRECVEECRAIGQSAAEDCHQDHAACRAACEGATTTSSTVASTSTSTSTPSSSTTTSTISDLCGNGVIDPGEECDTNQFGDATCPGSSTGAFLVCTDNCTIDFSQCPGVSTTTSTSSSTSTSTSVPSSSSTTSTSTSSTTTTSITDLCGNTVIDPGEECDTNEFGDATCPGSSTGAFLVCTNDCTIDFSQCPGASTTTSTIPPPPTTSTSTSSSTSTSTPASTSTTSTSSSTSTSTPASTSTTSTSSSTSTSTPASTSTTSTSSSTSSTLGPSILAFTTGTPTGTCGSVRSGGTSGSIRKSLSCSGLNVGGGNSTVAEGPTPAGARTEMNVSGGPIFTVSARTEAQTGNLKICSDTNCIFGPWLPISNSGTSTCVQNTFGSPASGTLNGTTGAFTGSFPLTSTVYLTANGTDPCPRCLNGTPGVTNSGQCQDGWNSSTGPSPDEDLPCTPTDTAGDTYDCRPNAGGVLPSFPVNLTPITTGTAFFFHAGGLFCPSQANSGAFGCSGGASAGTTSICPNGTTAPLIDYVEERGTANGPVGVTPTATTLASTFCIPSVGGGFGFLINSAANLPGPGATSLPGTLELLP